MAFVIEPLNSIPAPVPTPAEPFVITTKMKKILFLAVAFIGLILGFFIMNNRSFRDGLVELKIDGPTSIVGGDLIQFTVKYSNNNKVPLQNAKLSLYYPQDAIILKDGGVVSGLTTDSISLGTIPAFTSGEQKISAFVIGDLGNIKTLRTQLDYVPTGISTSFRKESSLGITISSLAIPLTLVAPPTAVNGQSLTYIIDYRNQSDNDIANVRIKASYPDGFTPSDTSTSPKPTGGQNIWDVPLLKKGEGARITVQGILRGQQQESKNISVVLQKQVAISGGDTYVDFQKVQASSIIGTQPLSVSVIANNDSHYSAHLGDTLDYVVTFRNDSKTEINSLNLSAVLSGSMFDVGTIKSSGFFDGSTNSITWNSSSVPEFNTLAPNQSGRVNFSIRLKNTFGTNAIGSSNSLIKVALNLNTPNVPLGLNVDKLFATSELVTRISSAPTFSQTALINDSQFGSTGPYPPKVGKKTIYTIHWTITNPSNELSQTKVSTTLAPGVVWENKMRVVGAPSTPRFDSRSHMLIWTVGSVPGGTGLALPAYEAFMQISVTPSVDQVDSPETLLNGTRFEGTDSQTQEKIARVIQTLTTSSIADSNESGYVKQ